MDKMIKALVIVTTLVIVFSAVSAQSWGPEGNAEGLGQVYGENFCGGRGDCRNCYQGMTQGTGNGVLK